MSDVDDAIAHVIVRVRELGPGMRIWTNEALLAGARSAMHRRRSGDDSDELLADVLGMCREAMERATGTRPDDIALTTAAAVARGFLVSMRQGRQVMSALTIAAYWYGLSGNGVHLMVPDGRSAGRYRDFLAPVLGHLGGDIGVVHGSTTTGDLRDSYSATVTIGTCAQFAVDYLRDNHWNSAEEVVQHGLGVAIIDNTDMLLDGALTQIVLTAPRTAVAEAEPNLVQFARQLRRGVDYRVHRSDRAVAFSVSAMRQLKDTVSWNTAVSAAAVARAIRVEEMLLRREHLLTGADRDIMADITAQGYLRCYAALVGVSSSKSINDSRLESAYGLPIRHSPESTKAGAAYRQQRASAGWLGLPFERVVDEQRSTVYALRWNVRDMRDPLDAVNRLATEAARIWSIGGADAVASGLSDVLVGHPAAERVAEVRKRAATLDELVNEAIRMVRQTVEGRWVAVEASGLADLIRRVRLPVIDRQWSRHLAYLRFIQRHAPALYDSAVDTAPQQQRDAQKLFVACWRAIHDEAIKYLLNLRVK